MLQDIEAEQIPRILCFIWIWNWKFINLCCAWTEGKERKKEEKKEKKIKTIKRKERKKERNLAKKAAN